MLRKPNCLSIIAFFSAFILSQHMKHLMIPVNSKGPDVSNRSFFSGLFWSCREATVDSSCWEFVLSTLEYPNWRKSRGLLCALTSRTAPGNASHSSSWQLLGHFQKTREKTQWDYFLEHLGAEIGGSQGTEIENTWWFLEYLWLQHLTSSSWYKEIEQGLQNNH